MSQTLVAQPLTKTSFAPFGEVVEKAGSENFTINNGNCVRHHALAQSEVRGDACRVGISIFSGTPYPLPHTVSMVERHPLGSQAFYPLGTQPWLVIVCDNERAKPVRPQAFLASADQGVNLHCNIWHGVLTPLYEPCDFLVVDRIGDGNNLEEFHLDDPFIVQLT